jgi:3-deoxy-7-phosphoheptulonate synthase
MMQTTDDLRIASLRPLISPALLIEQYPLQETDIQFINQTRQHVSNIIQRRDERLLVVVGPCSIHDPKAAVEYGERLKKLINLYEDDLQILMRVYFEKPRTTIGWKGLINDPDLDGQFNINKGLKVARELLLNLNQDGIGTATEFLDTIIPQFISDLVSWGAIGARTTESQVHRELASGLSMPVGFKNGTEGNVQIAIDAMGSAQSPHHFLSVTKDGIPAIVNTTGNRDCHVILRGGGSNHTNFDEAAIKSLTQNLDKKQLPQRVMIDCSHGNSGKDHRKQGAVLNNISAQLMNGGDAIAGVMLESHLLSGNQRLTNKNELIYGKSITDACIDWNETESLIETLANASKVRAHKRWSKSA